MPSQFVHDRCVPCHSSPLFQCCRTPTQLAQVMYTRHVGGHEYGECRQNKGDEEGVEVVQRFFLRAHRSRIGSLGRSRGEGGTASCIGSSSFGLATVVFLLTRL